MERVGINHCGSKFIPTRARRILREVIQKKHAQDFIFFTNSQEQHDLDLLTMAPTRRRLPMVAENDGYTPLKPLVKSLRYADGTRPEFRPIWDINDHVRFHPPTFTMPSRSACVLSIEPSPTVMVETFFPDSLLEELATKTNSYAATLLPPSRRRHVKPSDIAFFLAMYYYMGIVKLPAKGDYWRTENDFWPTHPVAQNISRDMFHYIWRYIHFKGGGHGRDAEMEEVNEDGDEESIGELDYVAEDEDEAEDEEEDEQEQEAAAANQEQEDLSWYHKVSPFLEHVIRVSQKLCVRPGSKTSLDEMMKGFKGRSPQTHRMKNKPIKEGFKFFAICDAETGYVYDFIPDGRLEKSTTSDYVTMLAGSLPEVNKYNYVIGMDNYFTWPKVMETVGSMGIGVVGTARYHRGWPPKEMRDVKDERFNTVYLQTDKRGYKIVRWVDNNIVTMVSNVHTGKETVTKSRRRPRVTNTNKRHLDTVWGQEPVKSITIPKVIDDYNHWMCGVDKADQLIAYYRPKIRCRRTWMPLFFHGLDVIRINSYIACSKLGWKPSTNLDGKSQHKEYTRDMINALVAKGKTYEMRQTRNRLLGPRQADGSPSFKRARTSKYHPTLPGHRLVGDPRDHIRADAPTQRQCRMCSYLYAKAKLTPGAELPKIRRPKRWCLACRDNLCNEHFDAYHRRV